MFQIILYFITVSKLPKSCSNGFPSFVFPLRCSTKAKKYVRRTGMNELDLPLGLQSYACVPSILLYGWTSFSPRRAFSESNPTINWVLVDHVTRKLPPIAVSFHHASRIILTSSSSCYRTSLPLWTGFRSAVCLTCGNGYREPIHCTAARVIWCACACTYVSTHVCMWSTSCAIVSITDQTPCFDLDVNRSKSKCLRIPELSSLASMTIFKNVWSEIRLKIWSWDRHCVDPFCRWFRLWAYTVRVKHYDIRHKTQ